MGHMMTMSTTNSPWCSLLPWKKRTFYSDNNPILIRTIRFKITRSICIIPSHHSLLRIVLTWIFQDSFFIFGHASLIWCIFAILWCSLSLFNVIRWCMNCPVVLSFNNVLINWPFTTQRPLVHWFIVECSHKPIYSNVSGIEIKRYYRELRTTCYNYSSSFFKFLMWTI